MFFGSLETEENDLRAQSGDNNPDRHCGRYTFVLLRHQRCRTRYVSPLQLYVLDERLGGRARAQRLVLDASPSFY